MDRTTHNYGHPTVSMMNEGVDIDIDIIIADLIKAIWEKNIKTDMSCGGDPDVIHANAWINFRGITSAKEFMSHVANKFSLKTWYFRSHYMLNDKLHGVHTRFVDNEFVFKDDTIDPEKIIITVSFPQTHIAKVTKLLQK